MPINDSWLGLVKEEALEPGLPICDPHHHLWDFPGSRYMLDELLLDTGSGHNVCKTVFIECSAMYNQAAPESMKPVGETEFVQGIAAQSASGNYGATEAVAGIVGFADLLLGESVEPVLDAHIAASSNRFRGIRHACSWDASNAVRNAHTNPPQSLYLNPRFRQGFALLEKKGLRFDSWQYHPQLMELVDLARAFPGVTIILDHVGGPVGVGPYAGRQQEIFIDWKRGIAALASCPNVVVKLGGLSMAVNGFDWHKNALPPTSFQLAETTSPYFLYCIEQFGVDRCMFESNFPVDKVSCSYAVLWNSFKRIAADFSVTEKSALFHDTAVRVYGLE